MGSADEFQSSSLDPHTVRKTYLLTSSQVDRNMFRTCESFGQSVGDASNKGSSKVKIIQWACCLDSYHHCHCSVKLSSSKRWKPAKGTLNKESCI